MPLLTEADIAKARDNAIRIQKAYKLKQTEERVEDLLTRQRDVEMAHINTGEIVASKADDVTDARRAVTERENELLNEAQGDALMAAQDVDRIKGLIAIREGELSTAIENETIDVPVPDTRTKAEVEAAGQDPELDHSTVIQKPRYTTAKGKATELSVRKASDEPLKALKTELKIVQGKATEPKTAGERNRLLATVAGSDEPLKVFKGELAKAEAAHAEARLAEKKARVEFNALNRDYNSLMRLMELKAATMRALVGFELETPPMETAPTVAGLSTGATTVTAPAPVVAEAAPVYTPPVAPAPDPVPPVAPAGIVAPEPDAAAPPPLPPVALVG